MKIFSVGRQTSKPYFAHKRIFAKVWFGSQHFGMIWVKKIILMHPYVNQLRFLSVPYVLTKATTYCSFFIHKFDKQIISMGQRFRSEIFSFVSIVFIISFMTGSRERERIPHPQNEQTKTVGWKCIHRNKCINACRSSISLFIFLFKYQFYLPLSLFCSAPNE